LLAPKGALIMLEQPELHLHSRAQARIADFFLALTQSGKQFIIETHSDSLVNQIRLRMVEGHETIRNLTTIYFAEQDEAGLTSLNQVSFSESGNIKNWPAGFFDEQHLQQDAITRAALDNRTRRVDD